MSVVAENEFTLKHLKFSEWAYIIILSVTSALTYADRLAAAGILHELQVFFKIQNDKGGLLQTAFILSLTIFSPFWGFLGDRWNKKSIIIIGVCLWNASTLIGSFMTQYWWFLVTRIFDGIGQASFLTIAPTLLSDLFSDKIRSKVLAIFYFGGLIGSGFGYVISTAMIKIMKGQWQWALRVTPAVGVILIILIIFALDVSIDEQDIRSKSKTTSCFKDIKIIVRNRTYMLTTVGFTCTAFMTSSLTWWGPRYIKLAVKLNKNVKLSVENAVYIFGLLITLGGLTGVLTGPVIANKLRHRWLKIDSFVCAFGVFQTSLFSFLAYLLARHNVYASFTFVFLSTFSFSLIWSIVVTILMNVTMPERRAIALGVYIFITHCFGAVVSPFLIGVLSQQYRSLLSSKDELFKDYLSLQLALYLNCVILIIGGIFYLFASVYIIQDKEAVDQFLAEKNQQQPVQ